MSEMEKQEDMKDPISNTNTEETVDEMEDTAEDTVETAAEEAIDEASENEADEQDDKEAAKADKKAKKKAKAEKTAVRRLSVKIKGERFSGPSHSTRVFLFYSLYTRVAQANISLQAGRTYRKLSAQRRDDAHFPPC